MIIYIASDKSKTAQVQLLKRALEFRGHEVFTRIDRSVLPSTPLALKMWLKTSEAQIRIERCVAAAMSAAVMIYVGPAGADAAAEIGLAFASGTEILGLSSSLAQEPMTIMRKLVKQWFADVDFMLNFIDTYYKEKSFGALQQE
jgi:hypothetical protein